MIVILVPFLWTSNCSLLPVTIIPLVLMQEAICSSLDDYNKQIEQLKEEMNDATHGADNIRNDISALAQRYAVIDRDEDCGVMIVFVSLPHYLVNKCMYFCRLIIFLPSMF